MKRHPFKVFSLVFGLVLILLAAWIAFPSREWLFGFPRWLLPAAVILLGAGLITPLFTTRGGGKQPSGEDSDAEPPEDGDRMPPHERSNFEPDADRDEGVPSEAAVPEF